MPYLSLPIPIRRFGLATVGLLIGSALAISLGPGVGVAVGPDSPGTNPNSTRIELATSPVKAGMVSLRGDGSPARSQLTPLTGRLGARVSAGGIATVWQLVPSGSAFRIRASELGLCLTALDAETVVAGDQASGSTPTLEPCRSDRVAQRWRLSTAGPDRIGIVSVTHGLALSRTGTGDSARVQLLAADRRTTNWRITRRSDVTGEVSPESVFLRPGRANRVTVRLQHHGDRPLTSVSGRLTVPKDWTVRVVRAFPDRIKPGATVTAEFTVTPNRRADPATPYQLAATIGFRAGDVSRSATLGCLVELDQQGGGGGGGG